ncbi:MAG: RtcB family protein [Planctomycetaceae bacterium]|jgi:tRNA-splicing ligase RtcB|nr:RtcB family protein [Planctomycetaceae bacterium]
MQLIPTENAAISKLVSDSCPPIPVIGTAAIRATFDDKTLGQAVNARCATGVTEVILNPDAHVGYGVPIGCVMVSPSHVFPGPVGVDIKCSMSLLQFDLPAEEIKEQKIRRHLIKAICERIPTGAGAGQRSVPKGKKFSENLTRQAVIKGASESICEQFGIPFEWTQRCEDSIHFGHDKSIEALEHRLNRIVKEKYLSQFSEKMTQFGSYGGGNHFGECEIVSVNDDKQMRKTAEIFGLKDGYVAFLSHCGSRGFGNILATEQFKILQRKFKEWGIPYPGGDREMAYAPVGSHSANDYLDDMALGANFATINHLLINVLVWESFREVFPAVKASLVYFISHNIVRRENWHDQSVLVHRKGATRAFPAGHHALKGTPFETTGHPILLPGNPRGGSAVMVGLSGAELTAYSINHGAGRVMGRRNAIKTLDQKMVDQEMENDNILTNCRRYPLDEAPAAYKNFEEVLRSVKQAGLAAEVARLRATFVIKDGDQADD